MASFSFILDSNFLCFFTLAKIIIQNTAILDTNLPWQFFLFILDFELCKHDHNNSFFYNMSISFRTGSWQFFSACIMGIIVYGSWHFLVYASYKFSVLNDNMSKFCPSFQHGNFSFLEWDHGNLSASFRATIVYGAWKIFFLLLQPCKFCFRTGPWQI